MECGSQACASSPRYVCNNSIKMPPKAKILLFIDDVSMRRGLVPQDRGPHSLALRSRRSLLNTARQRASRAMPARASYRRSPGRNCSGRQRASRAMPARAPTATGRRGPVGRPIARGTASASAPPHAPLGGPGKVAAPVQAPCEATALRAVAMRARRGGRGRFARARGRANPAFPPPILPTSVSPLSPPPSPRRPAFPPPTLPASAPAPPCAGARAVRWRERGRGGRAANWPTPSTPTGLWMRSPRPDRIYGNRGGDQHAPGQLQGEALPLD